MVELKKRLVKVGGSFGFIVPKTLIDCKVLKEGDEFLIKIEPSVQVEEALFGYQTRDLLELYKPIEVGA